MANLLLILPFLAVVGLGLPWLAWLSGRRLVAPGAAPGGVPSARSIALQSLVVQLVIFCLAWLAMSGARITVEWRSLFTPGTVLAAVAVTAGGLLMASVEARRPLGPGDAIRKALRRGAWRDPAWLAVLPAAGIAEEFAYRGVLTGLLEGRLGMPSAAVVSACLFGLAHLGQGWRGAFLSSGFALALQALVVASGGLLLAMLTHLCYDLGAVWLGGRSPGRSDSAAES